MDILESIPVAPILNNNSLAEVEPLTSNAVPLDYTMVTGSEPDYAKKSTEPLLVK